MGMGSAFVTRSAGAVKAVIFLAGQSGDQADDMMATTKLQFRKHVVRNLRPNREHDGIAIVEDCLVVGCNAHIRIARSQAASDFFVTRRQKNRHRIICGGFEPGDNRGCERASAYEAEFHQMSCSAGS
jgi:hypothetical protein